MYHAPLVPAAGRKVNRPIALAKPAAHAPPPFASATLPPGSLLWIINHVNFQYFSVLITIVSATVMVAVSCATPRPAPEQIRGLTFGTTTRQRRLSSRESWSWGDVAASAFVLAAIAAAYLYFTG